ncbi:MAG: protein YgfX [Gammaproteobacteria bacterium]|nr:protein YgfX [Gammaproteobacteria bacterium]
MKRISSPSSRPSAPAPDLRLGPSRWLRVAGSAAHLGALAALIPLPWPPALLAVLALLLLASYLHMLRPGPWTRLVAGGGGCWWVYDRSGMPHEARLGGGGVQHPWLVTLPLRFADGRGGVVAVFADAVSGEAHRALRRWLAADRVSRKIR